MQPISGLDATFLYAETPTSPMHVGSVAVIEGSLKYEDFREIVHSRIHLIPKLRQRLMQVPLSIDYPYWVDDPTFDLDLHLSHIALPKPGSWEDLRNVASKIFSVPLDPDKPLWSFTFVEGLDNIPQVPAGSVAIISKIHHVAIDGVAGASILSLMFDPSPEPKDLPEPEPFEAEELPDEFNLLSKSIMSFIERPLKLPELLSESLLASVKAGFFTRMQHAELPTVPFTAPPTPLNRIISARRKWNCAILSLDRIKALKNIMGVSLNDVMLAICAGALRRYLQEKEKLPHKPLVAMVPISTRMPGEQGEGGNEIASMLVQLATNIEDPVKRLEAIYDNTTRGKTYQGALGAKTLAKMAEIVPFGLANQAAQLYSRFQVAKMHNPVANVVITNVPGPQFPLYLNGHKLLAIMGMAPIIDGLGLIITIFSYNGLVMVSPTSDVKTMPDINLFSRYLRESANELEAAILAHEKEKKKQKSSKSGGADRFFEDLRSYLKNNPDATSAGSGLFQFHISGDPPADWRLDLNQHPASIRRGNVKDPDTVIHLRAEHMLRIGSGKLGLQTAIVQGRVKVEGDGEKVAALEALINRKTASR